MNLNNKVGFSLNVIRIRNLLLCIFFLVLLYYIIIDNIYDFLLLIPVWS